MLDFCCRTFFVPAVPDPAGLYGAICAAVPPCYLCGQGFSNNCLRFGLESGLQAELRFCGDRCEVWLRHCPPDQAKAAAGVYGPLLEELVTRLGADGKEPSYGRR